MIKILQIIALDPGSGMIASGSLCFTESTYTFILSEIILITPYVSFFTGGEKGYG
jgi:hypothetical protein